MVFTFSASVLTSTEQHIITLHPPMRTISYIYTHIRTYIESYSSTYYMTVLLDVMCTLNYIVFMYTPHVSHHGHPVWYRQWNHVADILCKKRQNKRWSTDETEATPHSSSEGLWITFLQPQITSIVVVVTKVGTKIAQVYITIHQMIALIVWVSQYFYGYPPGHNKHDNKKFTGTFKHKQLILFLITYNPI